MNYTYIVKCSDGTLYTGWTNDISKRIKSHNTGNGAKYTKNRRPVRLVYCEEHITKNDAMRRESEIKRLKREDKLRLIELSYQTHCSTANKYDIIRKNGGNEMNSFIELARKRESCRSYTDKKVDIELLKKCVEAALLSPSARNLQPWKYFIVTDEKYVSELIKITQEDGKNGFVSNITSFIVAVNKTSDVTVRDHKCSHDYSVFDPGLSVAHLVLQAAELGLGTCILGWFDADKVTELFKLPDNQSPIVLIPVGYPANETPRNKVRADFDEMTEII